MSEIILNSDARLSELAIEINVIKRQAAQTILSAACEIGKRLTEAKNNLPHGKWTEWLKGNVDYSDRTAQQLMRCWDEYGRSANPKALADMEGLTLSKAVALLGVDPEQRSELILSGEAEALSTRELQKRIAELKEESDRQQVRIEELEGSPIQSEELVKAQAERDALLAQLKANDKDLQKLKAEEGKLKKKAETAEQKAEDATRRALKAESTKPEKVIETVEITPIAITEELNQLRERLRTAPNVHIIRIREAYDRVTAEFGHIIDALAELTSEEAAPYKSAFRRGLAQMTERLE